MLKIINIVSNSNVRLTTRSHKLRFFGLKTKLRTQGESGLVAFFMSRAIDAIDNSLNRLDATQRHGETNNRVKTHSSGKLTDYTILMA